MLRQKMALKDGADTEDDTLLSAGQVGQDDRSILSSQSSLDSMDIPILIASQDLPKSPPQRRILCMTVEFWNIILLGLGFMFSIGAYQTAAMAQTVVLNSVKDEWFNGTSTMGYICLAINTGTQAVAYLLGPSIVAITGPKIAIVGGAVCISLFIATFLRPIAITIYIGSFILGWGVGIIWVVQGYFVTINSTKSTNGRNTGIFWALYQTSLVSGNMFYFLMLHGQDSIDPTTRFIVFAVLLGVSVIGIITFSLLVHPWTGKPLRPPTESTQIEEFEYQGPKQALVGTLKFAMKKEMWILLPLFLYIGIELSFWVNVYGTCLGYTLRFGIIRESLVGLNGVFVGLGEIAGGFSLGLLGKWSHRNGKDPGVLFAMLIHFGCFYLAFLNLPADSPLGKTAEMSILEPNEYIAMLCAFLLGFGDAVWNNQLMAHLGIVYPHETVAAFAVYQFWGAIGNTMAYLYSTVLLLPYQLLLLVVMAVPAAFGFFMEEWKWGFLDHEAYRQAQRKDSEFQEPEKSIYEPPVDDDDHDQSLLIP